MTHRDGLPRLSARSVRGGDAGHRKACAAPLPNGPMPSHFSTLIVAPASISMTATAMTSFFTAHTKGR